ncbi:MAG: restriction endonuclease subunit S [Nitrosomonadaceae bacterium]|nr:restriction endonuclease subunit S [Nitrosomonadaceae bacterium]
MRAIQQILIDHIDIWTTAETEKKSGRGRGSSNSVSVYGIKKLRELILGLAISGKLLHQESKDIPTPVVVEELGIRKKILHEVLLNEFPIPTTWEWHYISDLCELKTGATPSTTKPEYYGGQVRWLVSGDINKSEIYDCEGRITETGLDNSNCKILPKNSILIALNGQGKTRATVAILRVEAACNQSLVAIIPKYKTLIMPEFILINLRYRYFEIRDITGQNQRRGLNMGLIGDLSISVPPLAEQHRIVAKVDELMALCDQLEMQHDNAAEAHEKLVSQLLATFTQSQNADDFSANWQRIAAHFDTLFTTEASIDALKQTLLQLAVMGKLVPQDPNDEPASELLKRIQAEKAKLIAEGKIKKDKPLPPIADKEKPFELPRGWEWVRLDELGVTQTGTTPPSKDRENFGHHIPFIGPGDIKSGVIDYSEAGLSEIGLSKGRLIEKDSVLMVCIGGSIGKHAVNDRDVTCNQQINTLTPYFPVSVKYVYWAMGAISFQGVVSEQAGGSATPIINKQKWASLPIPFPALTEQHRIVAKVDELMALCDQLKSRIKLASQLQQKLSDVVVEKAISS